jgi:hypothetical protein
MSDTESAAPAASDRAETTRPTREIVTCDTCGGAIAYRGVGPKGPYDTKLKHPAEACESVKTLRTCIRPGDTVYTVLRHVSRSGMMRWVSVLLVEDNEPRWITYHVARACGWSDDQKRDALKVPGCGTDVGFEVVNNLGGVLFPLGFPCLGKGCPSNDHTNGDRNYTLGLAMHPEGGYALTQRWL